MTQSLALATALHRSISDLLTDLRTIEAKFLKSSRKGATVHRAKTAMGKLIGEFAKHPKRNPLASRTLDDVYNCLAISPLSPLLGSKFGQAERELNALIGEGKGS